MEFHHKLIHYLKNAQKLKHNVTNENTNLVPFTSFPKYLFKVMVSNENTNVI